MQIWKRIYDRLSKHQNLVLLYVLESIGSSPGRRGFKMVVTDTGEMFGSIGGGFMEHKLVELSKSILREGKFQPFVKRQIHRSNEGRNRSGMICSGEQTVAFYYLEQSDKHTIESLINSGRGEYHLLLLNESGLTVEKQSPNKEKFTLEYSSESKWTMKEQVNYQPKLIIIGGGHVGLALSKIMKDLDFYITVLDDRSDLNTMISNKYADECLEVDYDEIRTYIDQKDECFIALMSFGYRTDKKILSNIIDSNYKYLGVLGSEEKMKKLLNELKNEGCDSERLKSINTPIGINIGSKTPEEIAISIAAEIIAIKNLNK